MEKILIGAGIAAAIFFLWRLRVRKEIVFEYEKGLLFKKGRLAKVLEPGRYWFMPSRSCIQKIDIRLRTISVPSQEVLSADNVTIKITLASQFIVSDPKAAITTVERYQEALYMTLQLALRQLVGGMNIDELILKRGEIGKTIYEQVKEKSKEIGLELKAVDIKDVTFPGELKNIFAKVVKAKKEGQAILEKARGETAALRNLANAAKMMEENPNLMQLRLIHTLEAGTGNTIVVGLPNQGLPIPIKTSEGKTPPRAQEQKEQDLGQ